MRTYATAAEGTDTAVAIAAIDSITEELETLNTTLYLVERNTEGEDTSTKRFLLPFTASQVVEAFEAHGIEDADNTSSGTFYTREEDTVVFIGLEG